MATDAAPVVVATWNLHFGGDGGTPVHWRKLLEETAADLLLVQESSAPERYLQHIEPARVLWEAVPERTWGSGIYSATPIIAEIRLRRFAGWVVGAVLELAGEDVAVFSVHNPTTPGRAYTLLLEDLLNDIRCMRLGCSLVLGGDFNLVSAGERHPDEPRQTDARERAVLDRLRGELGLVSGWQTANAGQPLAQTLRWTRERTFPFHCDAIFLPSGWSERIAGATVVSGAEWDVLSDHNPVSVTLARPDASEVAADPD